MLFQHARPRDASIVAVFENQDDADEAVLELRLARFRDNRIGYFSRSSTGAMTDLLERNYWVAGAMLGSVAGAALGVWTARLLPAWESPYLQSIDPFGLMVTCAAFGILFVSFIGGMIGASVPRSIVNPPRLAPEAGPFVLAVSAEERQDQARAALRRHGGREVLPTEFPERSKAAHGTAPQPA